MRRVMTYFGAIALMGLAIFLANISLSDKLVDHAEIIEINTADATNTTNINNAESISSGSSEGVNISVSNNVVDHAEIIDKNNKKKNTDKNTDNWDKKNTKTNTENEDKKNTNKNTDNDGKKNTKTKSDNGDKKNTKTNTDNENKKNTKTNTDNGDKKNTKTNTENEDKKNTNKNTDDKGKKNTKTNTDNEDKKNTKTNTENEDKKNTNKNTENEGKKSTKTNTENEDEKNTNTNTENGDKKNTKTNTENENEDKKNTNKNTDNEGKKNTKTNTENEDKKNTNKNTDNGDKKNTNKNNENEDKKNTNKNNENEGKKNTKTNTDNENKKNTETNTANEDKKNTKTNTENEDKKNTKPNTDGDDEKNTKINTDNEGSKSRSQERLFCISDRHVHISVGKDPSTSMIISFSSLPCDLPKRSKWNRDHSKADFEFMKTSQGVIQYGTDPHHLNYFVEEEDTAAQRYNSTVKFPHRQFVYYSEWYHHITLTDLQPDTVYYYQCGVWMADYPKDSLLRRNKQRNLKNDNNSNNQKYVFSFRTGPAPVVKRREVSMVVVGDVGVRSHSKELFRQLAIPERKKDLVLLVGDIAYSDHDHRTWDKWMDVMVDEMKWLRSIPLQIAAGNHDVEVDEDHGEVFQSYKTRFLMPHVQPHIVHEPTYKFDNNKGMNLPYEYGNSYYSFSYGSLVRVIVLNSYAHFEPNSTQYNWFTQELQNVDRTETPWIMVAIHCPPYTTFKTHRKDPQLTLAKKFLEPVFIQYGVNLVVSGHVHAYMRTFPIKDFEVSNDGPMYFILGNGGRNVNTPYINSTMQEPWVANRDHLTYGYANFTFINETTVLYQWTQTGMNQLGEGDEGFDFQPPCPNYTLYDTHYFHNPHVKP